MERVIALLIGYGFGLIQGALIIGKAKGIDIRATGSSNPGATNVVRSMGTKAGLLTFAIDAFKCIAAVMVVKAIYSGNELDVMLGLYASIGAILGHVYPVHSGFRGGKGISAFAGMVIAFLDWRLIIAGILAFVIPFAVKHFASLGSLCLVSSFLVGIIVTGQLGMLNIPAENLAETYIITALITLLAFIMHRKNIKQLIEGTERKTYLFMTRPG